MNMAGRLDTVRWRIFEDLVEVSRMKMSASLEVWEAKKSTLADAGGSMVSYVVVGRYKNRLGEETTGQGLRLARLMVSIVR